MIAQNLDSSSAKRRVRLICVLLALPLFGIVAAFGIAPSTRTENVQVQIVEQALPLPESFASEDESGRIVYSRQEVVRRGDTVSALLARMQANDPDAVNFLRTDATAKDIYQTLVPGRVVETRVSEEGELLDLRMRMSNGSVLKVFKLGEELTSLEETLPTNKRIIFKSGRIKSSLFAATDSADIPDAIATQLAKLFATEIDFHHDIQRDDQFSVAYETYYDGADLIKVGRLIAAEFINRGQSYRLLFYEDGSGGGDYFTPEGKSLKRAFLRSPLEFSRVSSGFSMSRLHPILGEWRAHRGVDFPAPSGTPVLATCDGTVDFVGRQNGYGNVIQLKHYNQFGTTYAHLSAFVSGLHKGIHVKQGEVIGYVGATGWATGPHLHYEFKVAGVQQDPQGNAVPVTMPVIAGFKAIFELTAKPLFAQLNMMRETASAVNFE